jgi:hypothetical protein
VIQRCVEADCSLSFPVWRVMTWQKQYPSFLNLMYLQKDVGGPGAVLESTPQQDGFRMPAEWEPHHG